MRGRVLAEYVWAHAFHFSMEQFVAPQSQKHDRGLHTLTYSQSIDVAIIFTLTRTVLSSVPTHSLQLCALRIAGVWGYNVADEPGLYQFPQLAAKFKTIRQLAPGAMGFANLLETCVHVTPLLILSLP